MHTVDPSLVLTAPYRADDYFIEGITMPLRMIFWQERKTTMDSRDRDDHEAGM